VLGDTATDEVDPLIPAGSSLRPGIEVTVEKAMACKPDRDVGESRRTRVEVVRGRSYEDRLERALLVEEPGEHPQTRRLPSGRDPVDLPQGLRPSAARRDALDKLVSGGFYLLERRDWHDSQMVSSVAAVPMYLAGYRPLDTRMKSFCPGSKSRTWVGEIRAGAERGAPSRRGLRFEHDGHSKPSL
jgi:hypothetical protein